MVSDVEVHEEGEPNDESDRKRQEAMLDKHCDQLIEHFDSVVILASRYDPQTSLASLVKRGRGSYYTQYGIVQAWIKRQDAEIHFEARPEE